MRFQDLAYNFFANNDTCLVSSQLAEIRTPPVVTSDFTSDSLAIEVLFKKERLAVFKSIE